MGRRGCVSLSCVKTWFLVFTAVLWVCTHMIDMEFIKTFNVHKLVSTECMFWN